MMARSDGGYRIESVTAAPFDQVAYVAWRPDRDEALVVDPGFDVPAIRGVLERHRLRLAAILNTHGHADHIAGNRELKEAFPDVPLVIGRNEAPLLVDPDLNLSALFGVPFMSPPADRLLDDGEVYEVAGFSFLVREITGHSPGSVVFIERDLDPPFVLAGDVLFAGSIGRHDFPGGSLERLLSGIRSRLFDLPDETRIFPGHGPVTTIGDERRSNPFVGEDAGRFGFGMA
jgi:glyoxylase-like metal-dependent hydrolase (beta-lactamase superfamily II)